MIAIGERFGVAVDELKVQNKLASDSLRQFGPDNQTNAGGSVDVWFGPTAPEGKQSNWVQTIPGKRWFMILRRSGPLEAWFDKSWRPGEIELQM